jgi:hypothetical protein
MPGTGDRLTGRRARWSAVARCWRCIEPGNIELPPVRRRPPNLLSRRARPHSVTVASPPLRATLRELGPLTLVQVRRTAEEAAFNSLLETHHYLG